MLIKSKHLGPREMERNRHELAAFLTLPLPSSANSAVLNLIAFCLQCSCNKLFRFSCVSREVKIGGILAYFRIGVSDNLEM